jgi:hypothetical protein
MQEVLASIFRNAEYRVRKDEIVGEVLQAHAAYRDVRITMVAVLREGLKAAVDTNSLLDVLLAKTNYLVDGMISDPKVLSAYLSYRLAGGETDYRDVAFMLHALVTELTLMTFRVK